MIILLFLLIFIIIQLYIIVNLSKDEVHVDIKNGIMSSTSTVVTTSGTYKCLYYNVYSCLILLHAYHLIDMIDL